MGNKLPATFNQSDEEKAPFEGLKVDEYSLRILVDRQALVVLPLNNVCDWCSFTGSLVTWHGAHQKHLPENVETQVRVDRADGTIDVHYGRSMVGGRSAGAKFCRPGEREYPKGTTHDGQLEALAQAREAQLAGAVKSSRLGSFFNPLGGTLGGGGF